MSIESLLILLIVGAVAGWLAGTLMKGSGYGLVPNIVIGIIGALLGGYLFNLLGISIGGRIIGDIIRATVGAIVLIFVVNIIKKKM